MCTLRLRSILRLVLGILLAGALFTWPAAAESQARIVRLSDVQGMVQIDRNSGLGFENAFLNLPVTQGTQLRTRDNGRAEVEFEDGSTLRLTPNTTIVFGTLGLTDAGKRVSSLTLVEGKAYVYWIGKSGDEFTLSFAGEKIELAEPAHFRVASSASAAQIASFKGDLNVVGPAATTTVDKGRMVSFDVNENHVNENAVSENAVSENDKPAVAAALQEDPYDQWDEQAIEYHDRYAQNNSSPYGYGASDLNYYGSYSNVPGYGLLWQPYFAGAGWDPFMDGAWAWYPGMGYLWDSAYPWGWMPYYYGNWVFAPGFGWGWQPGGWNKWHGGIHYVGAAEGYRPPVLPTGTVNTIAVGKGGVVTEPVERVNAGSAGLGIPRGSAGNLRHLNGQVAKMGSAEFHGAAQFGASSPRGGFFGGEHATAFGGGHGGGGSGGGHASGGGGHGR